MSGTELEIVEHKMEEGKDEREPVPSSPSLRRSLGLIAAVIGLFIILNVCACGPLMILLTAFSTAGGTTGPAIQQALAVTVLGIGLGLILCIEGGRTWQGTASPTFHPRRTWVLWVILLPLLVAGLLVSLLNWIPAYLLPPINTVTLLIFPALILGGIGWIMGGMSGSWRDVLGGLVSGASLGTGLATLAEVGVAFLVVILFTVVLSLDLIPGGMEWLEVLAEQLEDPAALDVLLSDPQALRNLMSPPVVVAALVFLAVITPLIEEITKTLGMALAGFWLRPSPARAFLIGLASGAGFALVENLLQGGLIQTGWGLGILGRLAATLMHCATGGLMGWGWGQLWTQRRPGRLVLVFACSVGIHGLWNGLAIGSAVAGLSATGMPENLTGITLIGLAIIIMLIVMVCMTLAMVVLMLWMGRVLSIKERTS